MHLQSAAYLYYQPGSKSERRSHSNSNSYHRPTFRIFLPTELWNVVLFSKYMTITGF